MQDNSSLIQSVFVELKCARAVFTFRQEGELIALLTLHVDDGMMFENKTDPRYIALKSKINKNFKIKDRKAVEIGKDTDYTGMQWRFEKEEGVVPQGKVLLVHMDKYIDELGTMKLDKKDKDDRNLNSEEITEYNSYLAKARWPIAKLTPELVYGISALAQGECTKKVVHVKALNEMMNRLHAMQKAGQARLRIADCGRQVQFSSECGTANRRES